MGQNDGCPPSSLSPGGGTPAEEFEWRLWGEVSGRGVRCFSSGRRRLFVLLFVCRSAVTVEEPSVCRSEGQQDASAQTSPSFSQVRCWGLLLFPVRYRFFSDSRCGAERWKYFGLDLKYFLLNQRKLVEFWIFWSVEGWSAKYEEQVLKPFLQYRSIVFVACL